jgi:hypothetical protein
MDMLPIWIALWAYLTFLVLAFRVLNRMSHGSDGDGPGDDPDPLPRIPDDPSGVDLTAPAPVDIVDAPRP